MFFLVVIISEAGNLWFLELLNFIITIKLKKIIYANLSVSSTSVNAEWIKQNGCSKDQYLEKRGCTSLCLVVCPTTPSFLSLELVYELMVVNIPSRDWFWRATLTKTYYGRVGSFYLASPCAYPLMKMLSKSKPVEKLSRRSKTKRWP